MSYENTRDAMNEKRMAMFHLKSEIRALQAEITPQPVSDYSFETLDGPRALSSFFGERTDLIVVHSMGASCLYCTMWADGINGVYDHVASRAAVLVTSPDAPEAQRDFAKSRGWRLPMASVAISPFAAEMGYRDDANGWLPGVSVFQRRDGGVARVSDTPFGPGDDFCVIFSLFDLMPGGMGDWSPSFTY